MHSTADPASLLAITLDEGMTHVLGKNVDRSRYSCGARRFGCRPLSIRVRGRLAVNDLGSNLTLTVPSGSTTSDTIAPLPDLASATIPVNSSGSIAVTGAAGHCGVTRALALNAGGGGGRPASSTSNSPAPIVPWFSHPVSGIRDSAAPESLKWVGVTSSGWGESWVHGMNGGIHGAMCTQTLNSSTAQSKWVVNRREPTGPLRPTPEFQQRRHRRARESPVATGCRAYG